MALSGVGRTNLSGAPRALRIIFHAIKYMQLLICNAAVLNNTHRLQTKQRARATVHHVR